MSVSTLVLLGLAVVWAIVLLPEALKHVTKARHGDSIRSFNRHLSSLQRPDLHGRPAPHARPPRASNVIDLRSHSQSSRPGTHRPVRVSPAVRRRRQEVLATLGSVSVLALLCSIAFGGPFLALFVVTAGLLVAYVVALYQVTNAVTPQRGHLGHPAGSIAPKRLGDMPGVRVRPASSRRIAN